MEKLIWFLQDVGVHSLLEQHRILEYFVEHPEAYATLVVYFRMAIPGPTFFCPNETEHVRSVKAKDHETMGKLFHFLRDILPEEITIHIDGERLSRGWHE
jgi:hypothetical protein